MTMDRYESFLDWITGQVEKWLADAQRLADKLAEGKFKDSTEWQAWQNDVVGSWAYARSQMYTVKGELEWASKELAKKDAEIARIHAELARCGLYITHDGLRYAYSDGPVSIVDINQAALYAEDRDTMTEKES
jgi:hypothetical protein